MKKSRITKASKKRLLVFGTISLFVIGYFLFTLTCNLYNLYKLSMSKNTFDTNLIELKRDEKILSSEIEKLKDPEYIAKYARENYSYSKDGEYIIKITDKETKKETKKVFDLNIDYNYIIYGGILTLILIFIYALKKKK